MPRRRGGADRRECAGAGREAVRVGTVAATVCTGPLRIPALASGSSGRGERVAQVVDAGVLQPGAGADALPERLQIDEAAPGLMP